MLSDNSLWFSDDRATCLLEIPEFLLTSTLRPYPKPPVKATAEGKAIYHDALAALPKVHRALKVEGWALKKLDGCKMTTVYFCLFSIYSLYNYIYIYIYNYIYYINCFYVYIYIYTISLS